MKRELLVSFAGHIAVLVIAGGIARFAPGRQAVSRPAVITVEILRSGGGEPKGSSAAPRLVQPAPRPEPAKKSPEKKAAPKPRKGDDEVRRNGLGARVEGGAVLGYNYYLQAMLERIGANWEDPGYGGGRIRATVFFVIERDGKLQEVKLEKSSGDALFDEACVRAVVVTGKLPPLPDEFATERLKIHLEFER